MLFGVLQDREKLLLYRLFQSIEVFDLVARNALADRFENVHRRRDADVGRYEHLFEFVEKRIIDLLTAFEDRVEPVVDRISRLLDRSRKPHTELTLDRLFLRLKLFKRLVEAKHGRTLLAFSTPKQLHSLQCRGNRKLKSIKE